MNIFLNNNPINSKISTNSTNKLIKEDQTLLLIMDVQEKLISKINEKELIIFNIRKLIDVCSLLSINIAITEQNPSKLGYTLQDLSIEGDFKKFEKMDFSCVKNIEFKKYLNLNNFKNIIVCGIESHICILQSSIELLDRGFNVLIPRDAIGSRHKIDDNTAFLRLTLSGTVASTTESIICELCNTANRKEFKEISRILKTSFVNK